MKLSGILIVLLIMSLFFKVPQVLANTNAKNVAKEMIELETGYENILYSYNFSLNTPPGITDTRWALVNGNESRGYPEGMKLEKSGFFHGRPILEKRDNIYIYRAQVKELKRKKKAGLSVADEKKLSELVDKLNKKEKDYFFTLKLSGNVRDSKDKPVEFSKIYDVYFRVRKSPPWNTSENSLIMVGLEQSGASSADPTQRLFVSLRLASPFPINFDSKYHSRRRLGKRFQVWGEVKLTTLPQQISASLVKAPETFNNTVKNLKINEIARAIEFLAGFDLRLLDLKSRNDNFWYTLNLIGAYGATTPTTPRDSAQVFKLPENPDSLEDLNRLKNKFNLGDLEGKKYISFVKPERSKFYRQYYLGFRIKSYRKPKPITRQINGNIVRSEVETQFPSIFEVSMGRNDFIVDRELMLESFDGKVIDPEDKRKWKVLRMSGLIPIKIKSIKFYIFGTAMIHFIRNKNDTPLITEPIILEPALDRTVYPNTETVQATITNEYRDYYRIGVGVDLMGVLKKIF
jgi:hypothetical protein